VFRNQGKYLREKSGRTGKLYASIACTKNLPKIVFTQVFKMHVPNRKDVTWSLRDFFGVIILFDLILDVRKNQGKIAY
jgi:hypothetical protein